MARQVKITGGNPTSGSVLTSDASGLASWKVPASSPWSKNGNTLYYNIGSVGIGNSSPLYRLDIYDDTYSFLRFLNSSSGSSNTDGFIIGTQPSGSPVWIWNYENSNIHFATNNLNRMIIGADGVVNTMGVLNINDDGWGVALKVDGNEALWWDGTYFSWGFGGNYNYFADNVTIGVASVPGYNLVVNGTAAKTGGGSWSVLSDFRLKNLTGKYERGLNEIIALDRSLPETISSKLANLISGNPVTRLLSPLMITC